MKFLIRFSEKLRRDLNTFWPNFIAAHLDRRNQFLHCAGTVILFSNLGLFGLTGLWYFLPLSLVGYMPSWIGHLVFEKNLPPTLQTPIIAGLCELKMFAMICAGQMDDELVRLFGEKRPKPGAALQITVDEELAYQEALRFRIRESLPTHPFGENYWQIFLMKHQTVACVSMHIVAMLYLYALLGYVAWTGKLHLLVLVPVTQAIGLVSHAMFERNHIDFEDAIFSPRAFACLNRMLFLVIIGRYFDEVRRTAVTIKGF